MPRRPKMILSFKPHNIEDLDGRFEGGKQVKQRYRQFRKESGSDSLAQDLLCRRAAFLSVFVESLEVEALTGHKFHSGNLFQAAKTLFAILKVLGIKDTTALPQKTRLQQYLESKATPRKPRNRHPRKTRAFAMMASGKSSDFVRPRAS
jgi:hypothetical protein